MVLQRLSGLEEGNSQHFYLILLAPRLPGPRCCLIFACAPYVRLLSLSNTILEESVYGGRQCRHLEQKYGSSGDRNHPMDSAALLTRYIINTEEIKPTIIVTLITDVFLLSTVVVGLLRLPLSNHNNNCHDTDLSFPGRVCWWDHRNVLFLENVSSPTVILVNDCAAHS